MQQIKADEPFYQISQAAKLLGITSDRLRTYEEEGLIRPYRTKNNPKDGKRLFSSNDIEWLIMIRDLIKLGVSIPTIRILLSAKFPAKYEKLKEKDVAIIQLVNKLKTHANYSKII